MSTVVIETLQGQSVPYTYTLSGAQTFTPETAFATFDGTFASTPFLACMSFLAQDGKRFMRVFPTTPVGAGDVADVTFAPFPGGIGQSATGQGLPFWTDISNDISIANGSLLYSSAFKSYAMVQAVHEEFASVFVHIVAVLDDPGDPTLGYTIDGIPEIASAVWSDLDVLVTGYGFTGGIDPTTATPFNAYIGGAGAVVFPGGGAPTFSSGDPLFTGFGVYPIGPPG